MSACVCVLMAADDIQPLPVSMGTDGTTLRPDVREVPLDRLMAVLSAVAGAEGSGRHRERLQCGARVAEVAVVAVAGVVAGSLLHKWCGAVVRSPLGVAL